MKIKIIRSDFKNKKNHREAFVSLIDEYRRGPTGETKGLGIKEKSRLIKGINSHPTARVYFAILKEKIVGCAVCFIGYSTFQAKKLINIHDLIVTKLFRHKGIGKLILKRIENDAKKEGLCKITLEVRSDNNDALRLYSEMGFTTGENLMYFFIKQLR